MTKSKSVQSRVTRIVCQLVLTLAPLMGASSCGRVAPGGTDSNTHWLAHCDSDADCGDESCVCGTCFKPCVEGSECSGLPGGSCARVLDCPTSVEVDVCGVSCTSDEDCEPQGAGLVCQAGVCWAKSDDRPGDECDCQDPDCAQRISFVCGGLEHCPPTLDDALSYDRWPHEPATLSDTTYSICGELSTFSVSHWEAPYALTFGADGLLISLANGGNSSKCGTPPASDPDVPCRTCYVTRTGGLKHVGEPGEPARHDSGYYYCELDENDTLVMPDGIAPAENTCTALSCTDDGILGVWQFETDCPVEYLVQATTPEPCERTLTRETYQGTLTFDADGTYTASYDVSTTWSWHQSAECLEALGDGQVPSESTCTRSANGVVCSFDGTQCFCQGDLDPRHVAETGAFDRASYCVEGERLSLEELRSVAEFDPGSYPVTLHLRRAE